MSTSTVTSASTTADGSGTAGTTNGSGSAGTVDGGSSSTGNVPSDPADCGGVYYECGDGIDNDGDELIDLSDTECTGPCDDDESSFQTGLPGDNVDCKQDCFFDGNSGQGDDKCEWDLKCDPENPGEHIGCAYTGGQNCGDGTPEQTQHCIDYCSQFTPPGCDCFGCCTVEGPDGPVHIFLNSSPECSLENLDACTTCTPQEEECGNPCDPEGCEVCFGETEPPEGCGEQMCDSGMACPNANECPTDWYCYLGCCFPPQVE